MRAKYLPVHIPYSVKFTDRTELTVVVLTFRATVANGSYVV